MTRSIPVDLVYRRTSEAVAIKIALEPEARAAAKERQHQSSTKDEKGQFTGSANLAEPGTKAKTGTQAREVVAQAAQIGHTTLSKAERVRLASSVSSGGAGMAPGQPGRAWQNQLRV